jgi:very-short-patch-repair endonuclease
MKSNLIQLAKQLRKDSTDAERLLWSRLRAYRLAGHKFKRQQPLGAYILDFVCWEARLVIELDGGQHADPDHGDETRDTWLRNQGLRVLRFWNHEVLGNIDGVLQRIAECLSPSPRPSPVEGEGAGAAGEQG